jgi:integrase
VPRVKLTQRYIDRLKAPDPSGKQKFYWDLTSPGFGVLISGKTNQMSFVAQRDLPNGKTRRVTIAKVGERTLDEARREAADQIYQMRKGVDPKATRKGGTTLRETFERYLIDNSKLGPRSKLDYPKMMDSYLEDWLDLPLAEITGDEVETRFRELGKIGHATANNTMKLFQAVYNFASVHATLPANPTRRLKWQWYPQVRREGLVKADDLPRFFRGVLELENQIASDYLLLLLFTGLRRREAAGLTWDDVDFAAKVIRLPAARTKAKRRLDVPMTDVVHDLLEGRPKGGKWVFPANSKSGHIEEPKFHLGIIAKKTGIRVTVHDIRRTYITAAESTPSVSIMELKALVNHSLGSGLTEGYVIKSLQRLLEAAQLVVDQLKAWCEPI